MHRRLEAIFVIYSTIVFCGNQKFTWHEIHTIHKSKNAVFKDHKMPRIYVPLCQ